MDICNRHLYHEPLIHPACVYHGAPRSALILGGGEGATARELLKWNSMERVVMVDIDGELVGACKEFLPEMHAGAFDDVRSELIIGDAIDYLDHCKDRFDIVVCDLSDPVENSPAANFYTKEYILKCKSVLEENGYLIVQACAVDPLDIAPHARMVNTVSSVFNEVASYGSFVPVFDDVWGFIIAGDQKIDRRPVPEDIDGILAIGITGNLRMFDGTTLLGMMQLPKHVRLAIHENTEIYTLDDKPEVWNY
ncbi:MAG: methyltransferase domain-containing protein [Gammaproteobacteria bacterium]|nr:methyltransferase domain-containing protein [Gammaproteobacteria bacterium]